MTARDRTAIVSHALADAKSTLEHPDDVRVVEIEELLLLLWLFPF
eukprot:COSAG05_NODE_17757_length_319_cov_1.413636_1_plen_44_part_01